MILLRSFPGTVPGGRSYVVDGVRRLVVDDYDMSPIAGAGDDVLLLEWDIAVEPCEINEFAAVARKEPGRIVVAPYRLYRYGPSAFHAGARPVPGRWVWAHRVENGAGSFRHVTEADDVCHYFGFGMVYLPRPVVMSYMEDRAADRRSDWGFSDGSLSAWHWRVLRREVPIVWTVRPVHLHFELSDVEL